MLVVLLCAITSTSTSTSASTSTSTSTLNGACGGRLRKLFPFLSHFLAVDTKNKINCNFRYVNFPQKFLANRKFKISATRNLTIMPSFDNQVIYSAMSQL